MLAKESADEFVHGGWSAMDVDSGGIVKRTNFLEYLMGDVSLVMFPAFRNNIQDVVNLYPIAHRLDLFSEHYIFLRLVGE